MTVHTISLSVDDLNVIAAALAEQPYRVAAPVIARVQAQLSAPKQEVPEPTEMQIPSGCLQSGGKGATT